MKLGIPTLLELGNVENHLAFCKEEGFDFFEMSFMFPWYQTDTIDVSKFASLREENGIDFSLHLPTEFNPFSFSSEIRNASLAIADFAFDMAKELEVSRITMHLPEGTYASMNGEKHYFYDEFEDVYMGNVKNFGDFCQKRLDDTDIFLCIENTKGFRSYHKKAIESLILLPNIGFTFDVGHNYKAGGTDEGYMFSFENKVKHFHVHDVTEKGNHYGLGQGILPVDKYLKLADTLGVSTLIEVKELKALVLSVDYLKNRNLI